MRYAHGGGGYLLSRFACQVATNHFIPLIKESIRTEDMSVGIYMEKHGFVPHTMSDGHFMGHIPQDITNLLFGNETNRKRMDSCAGNKPHAYLCGDIFSPLKDVIFFHMNIRRVTFENAVMFAKGVWNADPKIYWWSGVFDRAYLCLMHNITKKKKKKKRSNTHI
jgi:hypothetical protein